jgi:hypothetical protein
MRPFAFKHQEYLLEQICKNTVILPNYKFVSRKHSGDFSAVLLYPNEARQVYLEGLGFRVFLDEHYDKNRLLFSDEKLLEWFLDDSKVYLDFEFSLKSIYLMK